MIKFILLIVLAIILVITFRNIESYQNFNDFYKLKNLLEIDDGTDKFSFVEESIEVLIPQPSKKTEINPTSFVSVNNIISRSSTSSVIDNDINYIHIENNKLVIRNNNIVVKESSNMIIDIIDEGNYIFDNKSNIVTINEEFRINIKIQNVTIDGNNVSMLINNKGNKNGIIHNGSSSVDGYDNLIIKNFFITYFGSETSNNNNNGEGGLCGAYFGRGSKNNIINYCYVYKFYITQFGGGIVGKYAGSNGGTLIIMNCIFSGIIKSKPLDSNIDNINGGGITGAYLGNDSGKIFIYNCTNYGLIGTSCGGIVGGYACNNNSHLVIMCCSNHGNINGLNTGGIVGSNSCVVSSSLIILCCYCNSFYVNVSNDDHFGGFVGKDSVLNKSYLNIFGCYNNYKNSYNNENFKYFLGNIDLGYNEIQPRNNDSKIIIDYCFNSNISTNIPNNEIGKMEFGDDWSNFDVELTNCGNIKFEEDNKDIKDNLLFSESLKQYKVIIKNNDYNIFPYNLIFLEHNDISNIVNDISLINYNPSNNIMNLLQYYDTRLVTKECLYNNFNNDFSNDFNNNIINNSNGITKSIQYFKLQYNILNEGCPNDSMESFNNDIYNKTFYSTNDICLDKSLTYCDEDKCSFGSLFNKVRCFPKPNQTPITNPTMNIIYSTPTQK